MEERVVVINVALTALTRLRTEVEHRYGREDREFVDHILSELDVVEWVVENAVIGGNRLEKSTLH